MYQTLISFHSLVRWLVLISLIWAIYTAYKGVFLKLKFSKQHNLIRHWTATIAHIQLMLGILLYSKSPIINYFWKNTSVATKSLDTTFFGIIHLILMLVAIVVITIGSALSKRKATDLEKFKTMLLWFSIALFIILIAIPWPFSPLANRPYFRSL
ncbi:hypothetical protein [Wenyingzhuangia aestuarii]|uniref:hypothetical protein n=1 Tax=Wenyingzhuangia aestuarii TaxID=1647582 RepID=UPI001438813B|nr:hypothetical protein [Wenyingzhuangia aestuarii]NJB83360.1 phosphoglycerol transferase MdoB-like AlkP superfamily enzyme [Wenyingzhuangia aestuarii]